MNLTIKADPKSAVWKITEEQWREYISSELEDQRFEMETMGPWRVVRRVSAPATSIVWGEYSTAESITLYGRCAMHNPRESGYQLEGRVSIKGKKYRAFTSSCMFELPDGRLLETAVLHVCGIDK